jgi:hypothetical protein
MQIEPALNSGNFHILKPRKALNKAFLKVKPNRTQIEGFKENLIELLDRTNDTESEEFHKNLVTKFLNKTYYEVNHFINTKGRNDLVIHNGNKAKSPVGVIIEAKKPTNRAEMLSKENINVKAFQELVLYYLRERITHKNLEVKFLIATNINEWFIFDANIFEKSFAQNKRLVSQFIDFEVGSLAGTKTDFFYKEIAEPFIAQMQQEVEFTHFDIRNYEKPLRNNNPKDDNKLIALFKLLSPEHLLKLPFTNDSNSLDKRFYGELLHILGLTETKQGGKKLIERQKEGNRNTGALLENAIIQLDSMDKIGRLENPSHFGETQQERLFNVGLELSITWLNRILFLKLLEAQLLTYQKGDKSYEFLSLDRIHNYDDLNSLFFQVLARKHSERNEDVKRLFEKVPYLNSSLFEPTEIEQVTLFISNLQDDRMLPIYSSTVLKDKKGKKRSGELNALEYLFEFLNSYDFSSEGAEAIQEDNKTLINASVLGLIFEKINGYKDGSFFTPGFITMYMCRETIRKAVVQKFNENKGWDCKDLEELYDRIEDRREANELINNLKICDPAVGSGHFLVSALNEIIAIKNDLNILQDRTGRRLKEYQVEVVNDELIVTDEDGELFEYNPTGKESQRIQEALFHEKQQIIENCLFGVDINPNSVKICRLRLWIELLKNAYYKNETELETLPNIDINIKCGNSLISRFDLDADLSKALKDSKWNIDSYRNAVDTYRNAQNKEQKWEMEKIIHDIKNDFRSEISENDPKVKRLQKVKGELLLLTTQTSMFEMSKREKAAWNKKLDKLSKDSKKFEAEIKGIKDNKIYENAFEWRFEFPEVLDDTGDYVGFDVVIGNPPYVFGGNEGISKTEKLFYKNSFETGIGKINLFTLFIEQGFKILRRKAQFGFIIPNTFLRVTSYDPSRRFIVNNSKINSIYDFGDKVFDDAVTTAIVITATTGDYEGFNTNVINEELVGVLSKEDIIANDYVIAINLDVEALHLVRKLKENPVLGSICKEMIFGVVITKNKDEIVSDYPIEGWKPFLEGKEIGSYYIKEIKQWLNYKPELLHRARTKEVFEAPEKLLIQRITGGRHPLKAAYDNKGIYNKESINNIILSDESPVETKYVLALLNSRLINWFYVILFTNESNLTVNLSKTYLSQIPLAIPGNIENKKIINLVNEIIYLKKQNPAAATSSLEAEIDQLVYRIYGLTEEEIGIVESS